MLDVRAIEAELAASMFAGKLHHARVTKSTNGDAMAGGREGHPDGSVWLAEEQTAGRGRGDHRWHSAAGEGLYVSVLLRPRFPIARWLLLPLVAGLAAAEAIRTTAALTVDLRWPNDLLIGPRKTGGILVESTSNFAVVGVGINVHQQKFPDDLDTPATSLDLESESSSPGSQAQTRVSRQKLLVALLLSLEREASALADSAAAASIPMRVARASTWVLGRRVEVSGPQACYGTTAGLDENGFLRVETSAGMVIVQTGGIRAAATSSSTMI